MLTQSFAPATDVATSYYTELSPYYNLTLISSPSNRLQFCLSPCKDFHRQKNRVEIPNLNPIIILPSGFELGMIFEQILKLSFSAFVASIIYVLLQLFRLAPAILFDAAYQYSLDLGCEDEEVSLQLAKKSLETLLAFRPNCNRPANLETSLPILNLPEDTEDNSKSQVPLDEILPPLPNPKKFSRAARNKILDVAGALEKEGYKPGDFYFFTGTLPGSSPRACEAFARCSRNMLNGLKQELRRQGFYLTFNCWEWQMREKRNLTPALHLHLVVVCDDSSKASNLPHLLEDKWFDLLDNIKFVTGVDLYEKDDRLGGGFYTRESEPVLKNCCKTIRCDKSAAAYLSKYVGKGSRENQADIKYLNKRYNIQLFYPSSWWSVSNELRQLVKAKTKSWCLRLPLDIAAQVWDEIYESIQGQCNLKLPAFVPDIPEWRLYQNVYVKSELYDDIQSILDASIQAYKMEHYHYEWFHSYIKLDLYDHRSFDEKAIEWLKQVPMRENSFYRSLPEAESRMVNSSEHFDEYITPLAGAYVSRLLEKVNYELN